MSWSFIAQRAVTKEFLDWDVPLTLEGLEWELSGPGSLKASIAPDVGALRASDGRLLLEEWGTLLHAEHGGIIRWSGILISSSFSGDTWSIEAAGLSTYPHARIYRGEFSRIGVDPADAVKHIWGHIQSFPDSDLGVSVVGDKTPVRLGELAYATDENGVRLDLAIPHKEWAELDRLGWVGGPVSKIHVSDSLWTWLLNHGFTRTDDPVETVVPPTSWSDEFPWWEVELLNLGWVGGRVHKEHVRIELFNYLFGHGWRSLSLDDLPPDYNVLFPPADAEEVLQDDDTVHEAAPYALLWWESPNCGEEIADLIERAPMDFVERHRWDEDHENIVHEIELGYPRLGRRRDDLLFEQGVNIVGSPVVIDSNGDDFSNSVIGLGAGEGRAVLRRETGLRDGRLIRDHLYTDKAITDPAQMDSRIAAELAARRADLRITSLSVIDHPAAVLGSWQLGDDVLVRAHLPWLGEIEMWVRITGWSLTSETTATLSVARSDLFHYGG